ncbi:MAG: HAD family hydrolase [bacterium]|nr:HAD family hydrolase [bacterium]
MKSLKFKKKYKALIIDVDGTLVKNKRYGMPSRKVTAAIVKASKIIHIGVATGRPLFMLKKIIKHLDLSGPSIINGGSQIIDTNSNKSLWEQTINAHDFLLISKIFKDINVSFFTHDDDKDFADLNTYVPKKLFNIVAQGLSSETADHAINKISHIPTIVIHKLVSWKKGKYDILINHAYATKQHAILAIVKILKIKPEEIIAVGDGYNDFPLLMACGLKIAMGNAVEDLKAIADYVAPTVDEDGVADVIEKFVLN